PRETEIGVRLTHTANRDRDVVIIGERFLDQCAEPGIGECLPPIAVERGGEAGIGPPCGRRNDRRYRDRPDLRAQAPCREQTKQHGGAAVHPLSPRVWTLTSTDMPGRSRRARSWPGSMRISTAIRCATLTKLPVALSGLITANSEPAAGDRLSIW